MRRDVVADATSHMFDAVVAGRAGVLSVRWPGGGALQCDNYRIRAEAMRGVATALTSARGASVEEPGRVCEVAPEDWDFQAIGEGDGSQAAPTVAQRLPTAERDGQRGLGVILRESIELYQPRIATKTAHLSLDRAYCLMPGHALLQRATRVDAPAEWHARVVSGHPPLAVRLGQRAPRRADMIVPLEVLCSDLYAEHATACVAIPCSGEGLSVAGRRGDAKRRRKSEVKAAPDATSRRLADVADADASIEDGVIQRISRLVMRSDVCLVARLLERSAVARKERCVERGRASLLDRQEFAEIFAATRVAALEASEREARASGAKGGGGVDPSRGCSRFGVRSHFGSRHLEPFRSSRRSAAKQPWSKRSSSARRT